jgi:Na+/alanine symporter
MGLIQNILDFINEKCSQLVDYVLNLFGSFDKIVQALILLVAGVLIIFGTISVIKKSAKLIVVLAAILVIVFIVWTFI